MLACLGEDGAWGVPLTSEAASALKQVEHRRDSGKTCSSTISSTGGQTVAHIPSTAALLLSLCPPPPWDPVHSAQGLPAQLLLIVLGDALRDPDLSWSLNLPLLYGACLWGSLWRGSGPFSGCAKICLGGCFNLMQIRWRSLRYGSATSTSVSSTMSGIVNWLWKHLQTFLRCYNMLTLRTIDLQLNLTTP